MHDWKALFPFESQFLEIPRSETTADWLKMHFVERGSGEQTILCVHGNPTWSFTYREVLNQLSDSARVIAVDHVGCGLSHKPQNYNYSIEQHIGNLARFIEQLDLRRVTLLLHDWGGAIGLGAATKLPLRIERLLILNTAAFPPPYIPWRIAVCRWPLVNSFGIRGMNLFARAALRMTLNRLDALPPAVAAGLMAPYKDWDSRIAIARFVQSIPTRKSDSVWQLLAKIEEGMSNLRSRPTRIVWGMKDWCFRPECLDRLQRLLPQAKVRRLDDVGHYVMEEAATEVIEELRALLADPPPP